MARKSGPIGRVRNVRNQDIGGIPTPYPVLFLPYLAGVDGDAYLVSYYRQDSQTAVLVADIASYTLDGWQAVGGVAADDVSIDPGAVLVVRVDMSTLGPIAGDLIQSQAWDAGKRGINGEWFAPGLVAYVP